MGPITRRTASKQKQSSSSVDKTKTPPTPARRGAKGKGNQPRIDKALAKSTRTPPRSSRSGKGRSEGILIIDEKNYSPRPRSRDSLGTSLSPNTASSSSPASSTLSSRRSVASSSTSPRKGFQLADLDDEDEEEEEEIHDEMRVLRDFDVDMNYGPSRGISRRERYERALEFELTPTPPEVIIKILDEHQQDADYPDKWDTCIWDQHDPFRIR